MRTVGPPLTIRSLTGSVPFFIAAHHIPTVEFFGDSIKLAATWRVHFDYGSAFGDFRAAYRAKGEA